MADKNQKVEGEVKVIAKIGEWEIERVIDTSEPNACAREQICGVLHNGLIRYFIDFGEMFELEIWFCDACARAFEAHLKKFGVKLHA